MSRKSTIFQDFKLSKLFLLVFMSLFLSCNDTERNEETIDGKSEIEMSRNDAEIAQEVEEVEETTDNASENVVENGYEMNEPTEAVTENSTESDDDFIFNEQESIGKDTEAENLNNEEKDSLSEYGVYLSTDKELKMHETGELVIWIGQGEYEIEINEDKVSDNTTIPSEIGQFAKITAYAPDFIVEPKEYTCIKIHPSGSEVRFQIKPKEKGTFKISANVELYKNENCTGTPVPKTTKTLNVRVDVDRNYVLKSKIKELTNIIWDKFLTFWGLLITAIFGALIIFIRRKLNGKSSNGDEPGN